LGILSLLAGLAASLYLSKSISTPLTELRKGVKSITKGNLNSRIVIKSNDEIREVADAFNEMTSNLNSIYTDLIRRTDELYKNNEELQSINIELQASYEQLEATMAQLNESDTQLRKKYNELQTLNRITTTLASTMDLNNMLITVVNQVADITEALICTIRLIDEKDPYKLELKALKGIRMDRYDIGSIDIREDIIGQAVEKKSTFILDLEKEETIHSYYKELCSKNGAQCIVFTPIIVKSVVIGVIGTTLKEIPKDELIELISSLANSIAIAIDNAKAYETLKYSYLKTVQSLVSVVEAKDEYTESHSVRVAKYASFIASEMNYTKDFVEDIWVAGVLHDIGKIGISDSILNKVALLTEEEYDVIKQHPEIAYRIVSGIGLGENILQAIKHHHERFDGEGYPDGIKGEEIPIMAAIISVADAFDAITSNRPYRKLRSMREGINEIVANRGTQFNPNVVHTLERMFLMKQEIFKKIYNDEEIQFF
jgi:putative nucleotidyltransferase with HDIG domain